MPILPPPFPPPAWATPDNMLLFLRLSCLAILAAYAVLILKVRTIRQHQC
ncbi:MAG TPA: hypothetical protein VHP58_00280 [Alphaproteobacteria bacterium]|nr:hypothetical protein [Alphaproteobacteria bacterium]